MEIRSSQTKIELRNNENGPPTLEGLAAPYYQAGNPDTEYVRQIGSVEVRERIMPGAFDDSLRSDDQWSFWNHDSSQLLGRRSAGTLEVRDTPSGPSYSVQLPDTAVGRDVETNVRRGDVGGTSIGFVEPDGPELRKEGDYVVREIRNAQLIEISPTPIPAYRATSVSARSQQESEECLQNALYQLEQRENRYKRAKAAACAVKVFEEPQS